MRTTSIRDHTDSTKTKLLDVWTGANDLQSDMRKRSRGDPDLQADLLSVREKHEINDERGSEVEGGRLQS